MQDEELQLVKEQLASIEAVLKAESKRRIEANHIMDDYIMGFMTSIEDQLTARVDTQFKTLQKRVVSIDEELSVAELQFEEQEKKIDQCIDSGAEQAYSQMVEASLLLRNVKGSFKVQKEQIDQTEQKLVKEVQMLLVNDKA